ncbi:MAG: chromosomal replication initiation protein DnaA [Betaproteobacteria bacterium]|nr:chromosomal replication initiation protein DnaA [Betaproteobacteria bacterium]
MQQATHHLPITVFPIPAATPFDFFPIFSFPPPSIRHLMPVPQPASENTPPSEPGRGGQAHAGLSADGFWTLCADMFNRELPKQQFDTWIKPLRVKPAENGTENGETPAIELVAPNRFVQKWVKDRYLARVEAKAAEYWSVPVKVVLSCAPAPKNAEAGVQGGSLARPSLQSGNSTLKAGEPAAGLTEDEAIPPALSARALALATDFERTRLNREYTFDTFVTGKANQLARAAAIQVGENPGTSYNPLFLYGGVGLGKTHLVQAIGNIMHSRKANAKIRYIHAEQYVTDVVRAYQKKAFDEFKRYYHSLDLLIIDDIQFFNGKNRTQEEFFYAFNALIEAHKQVIITCDTYPREIAGIEDRLISRFGWGLTVAIEPPELEMRVAILLKKAESQGIELDETVAFFIAKHLRSNVRELEGALRKLIAYSQFHACEITLETARDSLRDLLRVQNRAISLENIQKTVADFYRVKVAELFSKKRTADLVKPRQIAMYFAKDLTSLSLPEIGEAFGGRDHTTVLHAVRKITEQRKSDQQLNHELHVLDQIIKG